MPIKIQQQISETLQAVMGKTILEKLERFDFKKFPELNQNILAGNKTSIMDEMKSMYDNLISFQYQLDKR